MLDEWMAYAQIEPFGEMRAELRNGELCALLANLKRDSKRKSEPFRAIDFMHYMEGPHPVKKQTAEEQKQAIFNIAKAFKAKEILRKGDSE